MRAKKDLKPIRYTDKKIAYEQRETYYHNIYDKSTVFPKPLEYEDIDNAFFDFVKDKIGLTYNGKLIPTFKLYSNQRFSEYTQTWNHTDNDGNLLMNFKTVNRDTNPSFGDNQGGNCNIPGDKKFTLMIRDAVDDNGIEHYEIYSMKQPFSVDLTYHINFVTNSFEEINEFNTILNDLFKSIQCYIFPNGHSIPMLLDNIEDNTSYVIDDRKFYVQSCTVKAMAYIIKKNDFSIEMKPKRFSINTDEKSMNGDNDVVFEENDKGESINVKIAEKNKITFEIDTDFLSKKINTENVRGMKLKINDEEYSTDKELSFKKNDIISIKVSKLDNSKTSEIKFFS